MSISIFNEDCLKKLKSMEDNSVDLIVTDPPYGIDYNNNRRGKNGKIKTEDGILNDGKDNVGFLSQVIKECYRVLKDGHHIYWFGRFDALMKQGIEFENHNFIIKNSLIWVKNNHGTGDLLYSYAPKHEIILYAIKRTTKKVKPFKLKKLEDGRTRHNDILEYSKITKKDMVHDHQKPLDLLSFLIKKSSNEGDIVFDPFMGSGQTVIAANKLGRKTMGCELDKEIFETAKERIEESKSE
jgi:DNA modification methylase